MTFYKSFQGLEIDLELAVRVGAHNAGFHPTDQRKFTALEFTIHFMRFRMACLTWFFVFYIAILPCGKKSALSIVLNLK